MNCLWLLGISAENLSQIWLISLSKCYSEHLGHESGGTRNWEMACVICAGFVAVDSAWTMQIRFGYKFQLNPFFAPVDFTELAVRFIYRTVIRMNRFARWDMILPEKSRTLLIELLWCPSFFTGVFVVDQLVRSHIVPTVKRNLLRSYSSICLNFPIFQIAQRLV